MSSSTHPIVFLVGAHGTGKTTLGRHMQTHHGWMHLSLGDLGRLARSRKTPGDISLRLMCLLAAHEPGEVISHKLALELLANLALLSKTKIISVDGFPSHPDHIAMLPQNAHVVHLHLDDEERIGRLIARGETSPRKWVPGKTSSRDAALPDVVAAAGEMLMPINAQATVESLAQSLAGIVASTQSPVDLG
jgi:adenylate kinase family enzyme